MLEIDFIENDQDFFVVMCNVTNELMYIMFLEIFDQKSLVYSFESLCMSLSSGVEGCQVLLVERGSKSSSEW